jgi:hypothetical protein
MQGLTFGFADEIRGKAQQALYGTPYEQTVEQERDLLAPSRAESPWLSMGGEMGGAVLPGIASAPLAIGRGALGTAARGVGLGAAEGGLYGAGAAETMADVPGASSHRGGSGALIGGAVPGGVELARSGYRGVTGALSPQTAARRELQLALQRDDLTARQFAADAAQAGQIRPGEAMLGDVGGENVAGLVERVAQTPGAGRTVLTPKLSNRLHGMRGRLCAASGALSRAPRSASRLDLRRRARRVRAQLSGALSGPDPVVWSRIPCFRSRARTIGLIC